VPNALPPAVAERIETLQGKVQASLSLEGALREPLAQLRLNAEQLAWRAAVAGESEPAGGMGRLSSADAPDAETDLARAVETVRRLRTQRAALQQLRWQAETARLEAQARYTPERLTADLEVAQLPLRWARLWEPSLPEVDGALDLSLIADGVPESPELTLSATVNQLAYADTPSTKSCSAKSKCARARFRPTTR
jgi:autotransporter translocation and assembly factor TamB